MKSVIKYMAVVLGLVMCVACHKSDPTRERIIRSVERQLERYPQMLKRRRQIIEKYDHTFSFCEEVNETYGNFKRVR